MDPKLFVLPGNDWPTNRARALDLLDAAKRATGHRHVYVSLDGLERRPSHELVGAIAQLVELHERSEGSFVPTFVLSSAFAGSAQAADLVGKVRFVEINPVAVCESDGLDPAAGVAFLVAIARKALSLSDEQLAELRPVIERAARFSGGIPRTFLQLLQMASTYARLEDSPSVRPEHLSQAERELTNSFVRLLQRGDVDALREASGTDGLEVEHERKLRFLTTGVLLSYERADGMKVVFPAPALEPVLRARKAA